jgi:hypothetical protein
MSMMRRCEACEKPIPQRQFVELTLRVLRSEQGENQDPVEQTFGDYCDGCVASGKAVEDLVSGLTKYKGLEPEKKKERKR